MLLDVFGFSTSVLTNNQYLTLARLGHKRKLVRPRRIEFSLNFWQSIIIRLGLQIEKKFIENSSIFLSPQLLFLEKWWELDGLSGLTGRNCCTVNFEADSFELRKYCLRSVHLLQTSNMETSTCCHDININIIVT